MPQTMGVLTWEIEANCSDGENAEAKNLEHRCAASNLVEHSVDFVLVDPGLLAKRIAEEQMRCHTKHDEATELSLQRERESPWVRRLPLGRKYWRAPSSRLVAEPRGTCLPRKEKCSEWHRLSVKLPKGPYIAYATQFAIHEK